jgi:GTP-binding protein
MTPLIDTETEDPEAAAKAAIERGRWLFAQESTFITGAALLEQLPLTELPEIAFAGRSNVGKSSLVNALTGRRTLARTSHTPGRTQQLNFFNLGKRLMLVDLPGYGYAKVSKEQVKAWTATIRGFLRGRVQLKRVCLLIDSRQGFKDSDREMMDLMDEAAVSYQTIVTKTDKVKKDELTTRLVQMREELKQRPAAHPEFVLTSAHKSVGTVELRAALAAFADLAQEGR